jgi:hypothetical protein
MDAQPSTSDTTYRSYGDHNLQGRPGQSSRHNDHRSRRRTRRISGSCRGDLHGSCDCITDCADSRHLGWGVCLGVGCCHRDAAGCDLARLRRSRRRMPGGLGGHDSRAGQAHGSNAARVVRADRRGWEHEETGRCGRPVLDSDGRRLWQRSYLADFNRVRRQRVQTSDRTGLPCSMSTSGWRLGCIRRWARTRFMPEDCGLNPPIDVLPQMAQERAMRDLRLVAGGGNGPPDGPERGGRIPHGLGGATQRSPDRQVEGLRRCHRIRRPVDPL